MLIPRSPFVFLCQSVIIMNVAKKDFWSFWAQSGRFFVLGLGLGLLILGFFWLFQPPASPSVEFLPPEKDKAEIVVDVAGAVVQPGVYRLAAGARLGEAIKAAGGFAQEADLSWVEKNLNLARQLQDGEKIYLPRQGEKPASGSVLGQAKSKINLNLASKAELEKLPGIGPSFAQRIIDYRQSNGGFKTIEEIMAVPGIGQKTFEKIKDKITL